MGRDTAFPRKLLPSIEERVVDESEDQTSQNQWKW